jgi:two-component system, response regulator PdtaR
MGNYKYDYCIGTANAGLKKAVAAYLNEADFYNSGEGKNIPEFLRVLRLTQPWLAIIDTALPPGNIRQLASIIEEDSLSAALFIDTGKTNMNGYMLLKWPVEAQVLSAVAETLCLEFARKKALKNQIRGLENKLIYRKEIEKAKGILMQNMRINEDRAYRYLQTNSMKRRISMIEMAREVIANPGYYFS